MMSLGAGALKGSITLEVTMATKQVLITLKEFSGILTTGWEKKEQKPADQQSKAGKAEICNH